MSLESLESKYLSMTDGDIDKLLLGVDLNQEEKDKLRISAQGVIKTNKLLQN